MITSGGITLMYLVGGIVAVIVWYRKAVRRGR